MPGIPRKTVTYGCTELVSPSQFVQQLQALAARMNIPAAASADAAAGAAPALSPTGRR